MTIKRTVNGVEMEFELTDRELFDAYEEQQHKFDIQDIDGFFCCYDNDECIREYGFSRAEIETMYEDMADRMRRYIDKYDCSWDYSRDTAIQEILNERKTA
jgi:hypothetical protein